MSQDYEELLIELLALVYNCVDWRKIKGRSYADVFNHRLRAAARRASLYEAISKLCNFLGLQSIPEKAMNIIEYLRPQEAEILNRLYTEHIAFSTLAITRARELRETKKRKEELKDEI